MNTLDRGQCLLLTQLRILKNKRGYTGAVTIEAQKPKSIVPEGEFYHRNKRKLHNYEEKEGEGIPLNTFDNKLDDLMDRPEEEEQDDEEPQAMNFLAAMDSQESDQKLLMKLKLEQSKKKEMEGHKGTDLEAIDETQKEATMTDKTVNEMSGANIDITTQSLVSESQESKTDTEFEDMNASTSTDNESSRDKSFNFPYPDDGVLNELYKEDVISKLTGK